MKHRYADGGIYTAEMGQPPMDPEGGSVKPMPRPAMKRSSKKGASKRGTMTPRPASTEPMEQPTPVPGMKKGGSVSARADGIAKKGKTNCKMY
jgi:hypothetical protein